ncbi:mannan endo-1,6-alpha-mannosidase [Aureobasidium pullulans]|uniref:Mannan endo-1,6-alpha-mannosidase n=1 Tax=Aureobasidium pullulans TaxID=5580 RepID=A0AB74J603_AURPU|nr:mannan endo-1,6-alpha-mannosidase [Aureobasidium pullulans]THX87277.1 mannan endo-1,6-alpha-mannosidase [Aureobasidium pullulans]TIA55148.1 mannan endo-1,6-alpha-mannosidase [Aureobasidium pullulans]
MRVSSILTGLSCAAVTILPCAALTVDLSSEESIKTAASTVAHGMMRYYNGNQTGGIPGLLPGPYYWWEAGAMFGSLIDYWYYTGDTSYNAVTTEAMLFQVGDKNNYMPSNQSKSLGNDDQAFWGMAAMSAAELKFPNPPADKPQWLALAQAVFNSQALRWDDSTCGGGLRWQIFTFNNGYDYKNTISNGAFFNIAARLAAYTGNQTYVEWAEKSFQWTHDIGLMSDDYYFYDGSDDKINCTQLNHIQWSYNAGVHLLGAATMWNVTQDDIWRERTLGIWNATHVFFTDQGNTGAGGQVMFEVACEPNNNCNIDQLSFKAYLSRWMAASTKVAPWLYDEIKPYLMASAAAAALSCSGGDDGTTCGTKWWNNGVWDGAYGVGQQMSALEVIQSNLIDRVSGPVSNSTGGTSQGNPNAGTGGDSSPIATPDPIHTSDRAGAGIITALILVALVGGAWLVSPHIRPTCPKLIYNRWMIA